MKLFWFKNIVLQKNPTICTTINMNHGLFHPSSVSQRTPEFSVEKDGCALHSMALLSKVSNVSPCQSLNLFSNLSSASVLLRYNWHTALYMFKVYSIMIWLTYIMNDYHSKFREHSSAQIKEIEKYFSLWWEHRIYPKNFHVWQTTMLITFIMWTSQP